MLMYHLCCLQHHQQWVVTAILSLQSGLTRWLLLMATCQVTAGCLTQSSNQRAEHDPLLMLVVRHQYGFYLGTLTLTGLSPLLPVERKL